MSKLSDATQTITIMDRQILTQSKRIRDLEAALKAFADMWGSTDAHSTSKRAQAKRAAMWDLYHKVMGEKR